MYPRDLHSQFERDPSAGGAIASAFTTSTVSQVCVRAKRGRKKLILFNLDALNTIYLAKGEVATLNAGIPLVAGAWYEDLPDSLGYLYVGPFAAIAVAGTPVISMLEEF